jgi:hypothetical protein
MTSSPQVSGHFAPFHRIRRFRGVAGVAVLAALVVTGVATDGHLADQIRQSTRQVPDPYTELYFSAPAEAPLAPVAGQDVAVAFSVVGHEVARQVSTTGVVTEQLGQAAPVDLARLRVAIGPSRHSYVVHFRAPPRGSSFRLEVSLPASRLSIYLLGRTKV